MPSLNVALAPGTRLGPYEIAAQIGEGGMGVVYRGIDTNLKRAVAIKVLPDALASDPERLARLQREAEVLASLNHANIAQVHGLEKSGGATAIIMELVEGPTLEERIARGAIPMDEALSIARQIADALDAAHTQSIVHRDLKPANIKLRAPGTVKVLDFGLAKGFDADAAAPDHVASSPTMTTPVRTVAGAIVGTPAYMAPEQVRGEAIDTRADIWAYGVILFEMVTGRRLFARPSIAETTAAVLHVEPDYELLPAPIRRLCRSCLQKDPAHRLRDIADAQLLIDGPAAVASPPQRPHRLGWAVAGLFATLAAVAVWAPWRTSPPAPQPVRFQITPQATLVVSGASAISPDGRHLAFLATGSDGSIRVWVRDMESLVERVLPDAIVGQAAPPPFWSPDSRFIAFDAGGKLKKIDRAGGLAETIADAPAPVVGGSWNRDGVIVFSAIDNGILRVPSAGGTPTPVTIVKGSAGSGHLLPVFLPDGHHFLYLSASRDKPEQSGVFVGSIDSTPDDQDQRRVLQTTTHVGYVPAADGRGTMVFLRDGDLMAQAFDERRFELSGSAVQIASGVDAYRDSATMSVSTNGVLVYRSTANLQLTWTNRQGRPVGDVGVPGRYMTLALSRDGASALVSRADPQVTSRRELWLFDFSRNLSNRLLPDGDDPVWSPDDRDVIYDTDAGVYKHALDGTQPKTLVATSIVGRRAPTSWSPDGRFVLHTVNDPKTSSDIWTLTLDGTPTVEPFLDSPASESQGQFSPATTRPLLVAYTSNESGRDEVFVRAFRAADNRQMVSRNGGHSPRWRGDGRELFYVAPDGMVMSVSFTDVGPGTPTPLFAVPAGFASRDATAARAPAPWAVTPDGQRFLFAAPATAARQATGLTVVLNWQAALPWQ
jgi:eukaryotic-like serine/threonine-protein kinase